jgi:hypothetical protein
MTTFEAEKFKFEVFQELFCIHKIKSTQNKGSMCFGSFYRKVPPRLCLIIFSWRRVSTPNRSSRFSRIVLLSARGCWPLDRFW